MVQTTYQQDLTPKFEGQYDARELRSAGCADPSGIKFGRVVCYADSTGNSVIAPYSNQATLVLDADLVTSNVLAGNIVVGGVTTAYTETFASTHLATMQALAAELEAIDGVLTATVGGASNRTITVISDPGVDVYFSSGAVTLGASQAGVTLANTCTLVVAGVAVHSQKEEDSDGVVKYRPLSDAVPHLTNGDVVVRSDDALTPASTLHFRFYQESGADKERGMIGSSTGIGAQTSPSVSLALSASKALESVSAGELARITVNQP